MIAGVLVALASVAVGAPACADDRAGTVDEIVDALRDDPVLVHQIVGAGDTAGMEQRLADLAADLPFDVYVALVNTPPGLTQKTDNTSDYLLQVLHNRLKRPGLYVVETTDGISSVDAWGIGDVNGTTLSLMSSHNTRLVIDRLKALHGEDVNVLPPPVAAEIALRSADDPPPEAGSESYATMADAEVDKIAELPQAYQSVATLVQPDESRIGFVWMVAAGSGVFVLLAGQQTLRRAWPGWRRGPNKRDRTSSTVVDAEVIRTRASRELTRLAQALSRAPADVAHPEFLQQAMLARTAAEHVLDSDDLGDVVGALVLARTGRRDVERASAPEPSQPYRCCYFNPVHGKGTAQVGWRFGDAMLKVPACQRCVSAHKKGRTPDVLSVPVGRRMRPYYERTDVWARTGYGSLSDEFGDAVLETHR